MIYARVLAVAIGALGGVVLMASVAMAQTQQDTPLREERVDQIRNNCVAAQVELEQVQYNDIAVRINRGQGYDNMVDRLMAPFNAQAALDKLEVASELAEVTNDFDNEFTTFKQNYAAYEGVLSRAERMPCQEQPVTFYETIVELRELRADLQENIDTMRELSENYLELIDEAKAEVEADSESDDVEEVS